MITKEQWIYLCNKYNKFCFYEEIKDCKSIEEAVDYLKSMPTLEPQ